MEKRSFSLYILMALFIVFTVVVLLLISNSFGIELY